MHSDSSAAETATTGVAILADPGSAARKQAREATRRTTLSSVHSKQASRPDNHRRLAWLVVALVLAILSGFLPPLYAGTVRFLLHRNMPLLRALPVLLTDA